MMNDREGLEFVKQIIKQSKARDEKAETEAAQGPWADLRRFAERLDVKAEEG